jgi:hypothetical protein
VSPTLSCTVPSIQIAHSPNYVQPATLYNQFVDLNVSPNAVCNDGGPAVYTLQPGFGAASTRWIIFLEGGDLCTDQSSCAARYASSPGLVTSSFFLTHQLNLDPGLEQSDPTVNPDFYDANIVKIAYCSSDWWSGHASGVGAFNGNNVSTWSFQGHAIIEGVIEDLKQKHGLGQATEVLFAGASAGGVGVFVNTTEVAALLPPSARFLANPEAGYGINVNSYASTNPPTYVSTSPQTFYSGQVFGSGVTLWGGSGDANCVARAVSSTDLFNCMSPPFLTASQYIQTPMFIRESLDDQIQLDYMGLVVNNTGQSNQVGASTYMTWFANQMRAALQTVQPIHSYFAPLIIDHIDETSSSAKFDQAWTFDVNGSSQSIQLNTALGQWYRDPCNQLKLMQ